MRGCLLILAVGALLYTAGLPCFAADEPGANPPVAANKTEKAADTQAGLPTLFIVGDSTVKNGTNNQHGWGERSAKFFDTTKINVQNRAIAGRSSRTFINEGRWDKILETAKPGDFVIIQMGHNDGGAVDDGRRARGSLPGIGEETQEIDNSQTHQHEVVHTYGGYLRKYISDARAKGMTPILCSQVPHCPQKPVEEGAVENVKTVAWAEQVAKNEGVLFADLNRTILKHYVGLEPVDIKSKYFTTLDNTHTNTDGADLNAACVVECLRSLKDNPLGKYLVDPSSAEPQQAAP
ncbi:MAG TPA: rhamnogalacturonan acetylesterase [Pirellulales bacterium]|jgi:lysophospholipase L1-like esterase|nr:rhamnogalacturonan acetylesterase [Pirellulales bacterium]